MPNQQLHSTRHSAILHFVNDSAISTRAAERKQATASRLSAVSRRLTADRGLSGFTIEEVCEEVGVSRRTFFNYFPSKEEAVLGVDESQELLVFTERFLAQGTRGWSSVVDDLVALISEYAIDAGLDADEHLELIRAVDREPRLLARFIGMGRERETQLLELVALREGVATSDVRARAAVDVVSTLLRSSAERLLQPEGAESFGAALTTSLAALREVLDVTRKAQQ